MDTEEEEVMENLVMLTTNLHDEHVKIEMYVEKIVHNYTEVQFRENFRMSRAAFEMLLEIVCREWPLEHFGRKPMERERQLLSVIWILATPDSFRSVSERFGFAKGSMSLFFNKVINIINRVSSRFIKWPDSTRMIQNKNEFEKLGGLKNVIGAVDGTYVACKVPKDQYLAYTNRKMFQSITLQATCDARLKYIDCTAGYPSSTHDARIFKNSRLYSNGIRHKDQYFPGSTVILHPLKTIEDYLHIRKDSI